MYEMLSTVTLNPALQNFFNIICYKKNITTKKKMYK